jgi:hypothetical protein
MLCGRLLGVILCYPIIVPALCRKEGNVRVLINLNEKSCLKCQDSAELAVSVPERLILASCIFKQSLLCSHYAMVGCSLKGAK